VVGLAYKYEMIKKIGWTSFVFPNSVNYNYNFVPLFLYFYKIDFPNLKSQNYGFVYCEIYFSINIF
jgi:hypothetical protein